jgi:hypothetical protein
VTFPPTPFGDSAILDEPAQAKLNALAGNPFRTWTLCYRRTRDGGPVAFHAGCDLRGPTIMVVKLSDGKIIGAYSDIDWDEREQSYFGSYGAFLFSLTGNKRYPIGTGQYGAEYAVYRHPAYGPAFGGGHDLFVNLTTGFGYCHLSFSYVCNGSIGGPNPDCSLEFCGKPSSADGFTIVELEVFYLN